MMEQLATSETFNSCSLSVVHRPAVTSNNQPHKESTSRWCLHVWVCARETIPFSALKVSPCVPFFFKGYLPYVVPLACMHTVMS